MNEPADGDSDSGTAPSDAATDGSGDPDAVGDADADAAATDVADALEPGYRIDALTPSVADPLGGSWLTLRGAGFEAVQEVSIDSIAIPRDVLSDTEMRLRVPPMPPGEYPLVLVPEPQGGAQVLVWSPDTLPGAHVFDAAVGVVAEAVAEPDYAWEHVGDLPAAWRVRDGNTTTWFPATGRFWMVAGWNGLQEPAGFSSVPPDSTYPPENTTDEVWSSADGVEWTLELAHGHGQFERRHVHNTVVWNDRLWMIGGDAHQGRYNHDVVSSADGRTWVEELAPGEPPWTPRALQISGVYNGLLWTGGGQDLLGDAASYVHHNDLWSSADGQTWVQVAADGPASATRWGGCGAVDGFVEFAGRMWLVGCARYDEVGGHQMVAEVWSTTDGVTWQRHADPPWAGKIWHNVVVWDGRIWALFGYTNGDPANGWPQDNSKEAWYTLDGETWTAAVAPDHPIPGSHAQGVAVTPDALWYVGGNHTFGVGLGEERSIWRMVRVDGDEVSSWTARGASSPSASAEGAARPRHVADAFGPGRPGIYFDGSFDALALTEPDAQPEGRTVLWAARMPEQRVPLGWEETYAPLGTVLGGVDGAYPNSSVGMSAGQVVVVNREAALGPAGEPLWVRLAAGEGLQELAGDVHTVGFTHAVDGTVTAVLPTGSVAAGMADYSSPRSYSRIGGSLDDGYYGPNTRFAGTLGAVVVLPYVADAATLDRIAQWAEGRFATP